ncbi:MAG: hypothetical protein LBC20_10900 [Planctomycetaceae bacterium]|jgi:hypothetical protein|nr:hypothetical protein [Planctomycetaceae bacterium]
MRFTTIIFVAIFLVLMIGCSRKTQVSGKVTFDDGSTLTVGEVRFESAGFLASGKIQSDGTYRLGSVSKSDGVPKGSYKVSIFAMDESGNKPGMPLVNVPVPKSLVAEKYRSGETSGLVCEVNGSTTFDITVEKPKQ